MSVVTARSARRPSAAGSVQETLYGEVVSVPSETQLPVEQPALVFEHWKNSTCVTDGSVLEAVIVNGSGEDELR